MVHPKHPIVDDLATFTETFRPYAVHLILRRHRELIEGAFRAVVIVMPGQGDLQ